MRLPRLIVSLIAAVAGLAAPAASRADPSLDYVLHCRGCHGPEGAGVAGSVPDFRGQVGRFLFVPGGREYLVRVPGTSQSELSDARVAALLNWLVREFGADQVPDDLVEFDEAEVARVRRPPLTDVDAVRRALLEALAQRGDGSR